MQFVAFVYDCQSNNSLHSLYQLVKDFSAITRTAEAYRMDKVAKANITVKHKQTGELITFENMRTNIEYYYAIPS